MRISLNTGSPHRGLAGWGWFCAWGALGAAAALGAISLGPLVLVPAIIAAAIMLARRGVRESAFGLLSGAGVVLLAVAWANRAGPGTTCWHTASSSGCDQHLNPIPWLVVGIVFLAGGLLAQGARQR